MILLIGVETDTIIRKIATLLILNEEPCLFLDIKKITHTIHYNDNELIINNKKYEWHIFSGFYHRIPGLKPNSGFPQNYTNALDYLINLLNFKLINVINKPLNCVMNNSKLLQLNFLNTSYINKPNSLVIAKYNFRNISMLQSSNFVYKSLSSVRSIVTQYKPNHSSDILHFEPVQFQHLINGDNIRVHVIGKNVFPIKISAKEIDYRYDYENRIFEVCNLPKRIKTECIELARQSDLVFCGIDLINSNEIFYILEINPTPAYLFFEDKVKNNLMTESLIAKLKKV